MIWWRTWKIGMKSLMLHPMRSILTVLGMLFGVASVIWLLAIGEGISIHAREQIEGLGADNIIVRSIKPPSEKTSGNRGPTPYGLKRAEYDKLLNTIPTIRSALPIREIRRQFQYKDRLVDGRLVGCTEEYADVTRLVVDQGRFLTAADAKHLKSHCVLAAKVARRLFPYEDPIGERVYLPEHSDFYTVIGVLKHRDATAAIGGSLAAQDFSSDIYIPIATLKQRIGDMVIRRGSGTFEADVIELDQITLRVDQVNNVNVTADLVEQTLTGHEKLEDIAITVPNELLEHAKNSRNMFILFMGLIAAVTLLVGGIGIMNIMLATVTERTREIGIRRALGARRGDIIRQFLVETIGLSILGGLAGVLLGFIGPALINWGRDIVTEKFPEIMAKLPAVVQHAEPTIVPISIPIAFGISVVVGVLFGIYPAYRAAQMDPIEALRHE